MNKLTIILPFPLPTWNLLLSVNRWRRKKIRDLIHTMVKTIVDNKKISRMLINEYYQEIGRKPPV